MLAKLYLLPTTLGESSIDYVIPREVTTILKNTTCFIVENLRTARRYIKRVDPNFDIDASTFFILNKHSKVEEYSSFLSPCLNGIQTAILSEAGCPCIADPGALIVEQAHKKNIEVIPLVGPSSILLSLMASGFNGQNFAFHGYLPYKENRIETIKQLEKESRNINRTQIFIETPFRNNALLEDLLKTCHPKTKICIAVNISTKEEYISTKTCEQWKLQLVDLNKKPAIFLLYAF